MIYLDYIVAIKNAVLAKRRQAKLPFSSLNLEISKVLKKEGFLEDYKEEKDGNKKVISAKIAYDKRTPRLTDIVIVSRSSLRKYVGSKEIFDLERKGRKTLIISTSSGVMTGKEAAKRGVGGEVLFAIM